ncbi:MAG: tRNA lysidine(34) synthetase TilS [Clostridiaceae bacterium]
MQSSLDRSRLFAAETLYALGVGPADRVLVAFSGGADSTAMLLRFNELLAEGKIAGLSAAHLHHGIRGQSANDDLAFCVALCNQLGVPVLTERADAPAYAREKKQTLEQAARELRYAFLERARLHFQADVVAVAHHRGDQAETVLMHLLRGCGLAGLAGMRARTGRIIRPMLDSTRAEILAYLAERDQAFCEDETNAQNDAFRSRIRNELLPVLETYQPNVTEALCKTAAFSAEDEDYLLLLSEQAEETILHGDGLNRKKLSLLPIPLKTRIVKRRILALNGDVSEADIRRVLALAEARTGTAIELSGGFCAWTSAVGLQFGVYPASVAFETPFVREGTTSTPLGTFLSERVEAYAEPADANEAYLDADALPEELVVRTRRTGDRFWPLGAPGAKKLNDVLIDKKIPREQRDIPLVCAGNEVLFAAGLAVSERAKILPETKTILHITFTGGKVS